MRTILNTVQNSKSQDTTILPEPEPPNANDTLESIDEFTTLSHRPVESIELPTKKDIKKNMKTRVQFDSETCEFSVQGIDFI